MQKQHKIFNNMRNKERRSGEGGQKEGCDEKEEEGGGERGRGIKMTRLGYSASH